MNHECQLILFTRSFYFFNAISAVGIIIYLGIYNALQESTPNTYLFSFCGQGWLFLSFNSGWLPGSMRKNVNEPPPEKQTKTNVARERASTHFCGPWSTFH